MKKGLRRAVKVYLDFDSQLETLTLWKRDWDASDFKYLTFMVLETLTLWKRDWDTPPIAILNPLTRWKHWPYEKGIETFCQHIFVYIFSWKHWPYEKGIETWSNSRLSRSIVGNIDLMKKGLRPPCFKQYVMFSELETLTLWKRDWDFFMMQALPFCCWKHWPYETGIETIHRPQANGRQTL